jgi:hypothetical protein
VLAFVPRRQLGKIVPQIGDRQFAGIAQSFLHDEVDNKITLGNIWIYGPHELNGEDRPRLEGWPKLAQWHNEPWRTLSRLLTLPNVSMPGNVKDFLCIRLGFALSTPFFNFNKKSIGDILFEN